MTATDHTPGRKGSVTNHAPSRQDPTTDHAPGGSIKPTPGGSAGPLLQVRDLVVDYRLHGRKKFRALQGVDLDIAPGECVGLVGESGSGKSTRGKAVLGLAPVSAGTITFDGQDITHAGRRARKKLAEDLQVVFQDPFGSLDPTMTIGQILAEPLRVSGVSKARARERVLEILHRVTLPEDALDRYPAEFSGGQRQRVAIARSLVRKPRLVICDEPVSALDLTTQATILDLFINIQRDTGVAYLFISHDLGVVRRICHRISVMYKGNVVESGNSLDITQRPQEDYTKNLLLASPVADPAEQAERRRRWLELRDRQAA